MNFNKQELKNVGVEGEELKLLISVNKAMEIKEIDVDGKLFNGVNGRQLHEFLEIKTRFADWIKRRIEDYKFTEGVDYQTYCRIERPSENTTKTFTEYIISYVALKGILAMDNTNERARILYQLLFNNGNDLFVYKPSRKEECFSEMLETITGVEWLKQLSIDGGKYFIDFYHEDGIIVEYDEKYHTHQIDKDIKRMNFCIDYICNNYLNNKTPVVIRVEEGREYEGINKIIKALLNLGTIKKGE